MFLPLHDQNPIRHIKFPYVNYTLIVATILIFGVQSILPQQQFDATNVNFGMIPIVVRDLVMPPLPWLPEDLTLATYAFLHADWMHLLTNMLFLWIFGDNVEDALGHARYLIFYILCAVLAAGAHILMNLDSNGPLIGASGAVAGVMGAYVLLYPHVRIITLARVFIIPIPIPLPLPAFWMLGFWFLTQLFYAFMNSGEPVAWWAHIGGMVAGAALVTILKRREIPLFGRK